MKTGMLGVSFHTAPLDVRAKAALSDRQKTDLAKMLSEIGVQQVLFLCTCNRSEIYYLYEQQSETVPQQVQHCFLQICQAQKELQPHLYCLKGTPALEQLFRVAAGLDSLILGEDQILAQLQQAAVFSRAIGTSGKEMNRIVQNAAACAKAVKTAYPVSSQPLSVCYIGMKQLNQAVPLAQKVVCVIGSGKMATLAVRYLVDFKAEKILLCSRNPETAKKLQQQFGNSIEWIPFSQRSKAICQSSAVVCATSAPHFVVTETEVQLCDKLPAFLDLAVPRDVSPTLTKNNNGFLLDVDSLKQTGKENLEKRRSLAKQSEQDIAQAVAETEHWLVGCAVDAPIQTLKAKVEQVEQDTAALLCERLQLTSHQQKLLKKLLHAGMNRLLKEPIAQLKSLNDEHTQKQFSDMVEYLFAQQKE